MNWHLQDAKNNLSKMVQKAPNEGPQTLTLRGKRAAVLVAADTYDSLVRNKPSFEEFLLHSEPFWDDEFVEDVNRRNQTPAREIDL
jgi:prevent-host-death family protein